MTRPKMKQRRARERMKHCQEVVKQRKLAAKEQSTSSNLNKPRAERGFFVGKKQTEEQERMLSNPRTSDEEGDEVCIEASSASSPSHEAEAVDPLTVGNDPGPSTSADILSGEVEAPMLLDANEVEMLLSAYKEEEELWRGVTPHRRLTLPQRARRLAALGRIAKRLNIGPTVATALLIRYTKMFRDTFSLHQHVSLSHWYNRMKFLIMDMPSPPIEEVQTRTEEVKKGQPEKMVIIDGGEEMEVMIKEEVPSDSEDAGSSKEQPQEWNPQIVNAPYMERTRLIVDNLVSDCDTLRSEQKLMQLLDNLEDSSEPAAKRQRLFMKEKEMEEKGAQTCKLLFSDKVQLALAEKPLRDQFDRLANLIEKNTTLVKSNQLNIKKTLDATEMKGLEKQDKFDRYGKYVASVLRTLTSTDAAVVQLKISKYIKETHDSITQYNSKQ